MSEYIIDLNDENANVVLGKCDGVHKEIVRCRDCRHFNEYHGKCHRQSGVLIDDYSTRRLENLGDVLVLTDAEPGGFCAWGERRSE